jgi:O-succinylhomoserine sulfhydrylase
MAVRAGQVRGSEQEHSEPIYTTSSFTFGSAAEAAARFSQEVPGNVYSRFTNPTVRAFEQRLAAMEGGEACVATASGMAGLLAICLSGLQHGDHIISARSIFGASRVLLTDTLQKCGVDTTLVDLNNMDHWRQALTSRTRMVFFETPTNPLTELADIQAISDLVHDFNPEIRVVVDNCFCSPALQQPLLLGADVVLHSATKFIDGQGRCVGGAVVGSDEFVGQKVGAFMRTAGPSMSPFNAWVFLKGLETLDLRVSQACDNAAQLADYLNAHPKIERVYYPGLIDHPQHELSKTQQRKAGAIVSFTVKGGQDDAWQLIDNTELMSITANLGDTRTTITHPFTTTHARWSEEDKLEVGITESLIRIAVGLEDPLDLIDDLRF